MARPSKQIDRKLIGAAKKLVYKEGLAGLSLRRLAADTGVNLGMFHYFFKTKDRFKRRVLQEVYEDFFKEFKLEAEKEAPALDRLRSAVLFAGRFVRERRRLILALLHDALGGDKVALDFLKQNLVRHVSVIAGLLGEAQGAGDIQRRPVLSLLPLLLGAVGLPSLMLAGLERAGIKRPFGMALPAAAGLVLSDEAMADRLDMALKGMR